MTEPGLQTDSSLCRPLTGYCRTVALLDVARSDDRHTSQWLSAEPIIWLCTVRPDGRPHNVPVWFALARPDDADLQHAQDGEGQGYATVACGQSGAGLGGRRKRTSCLPKAWLSSSLRRIGIRISWPGSFGINTRSPWEACHRQILITADCRIVAYGSHAAELSLWTLTACWTARTMVAGGASLRASDQDEGDPAYRPTCSPLPAIVPGSATQAASSAAAVNRQQPHRP